MERVRGDALEAFDREHRRPRLAHPRRHRGRSAASPPHPHRARRGLRLRARPGRGLMRRLYLQVYAAFVAILLVFSVLVAAAWHHGALAAQDQDTPGRRGRAGRGAAALGLAPLEQQHALRSLAATLRLNPLVVEPGRPVAGSGGRASSLPGRTPEERVDAGARRTGRHPAPAGWPLAGGPADAAPPGARRHLRHPGLLAVAVAIGAFPVVRRLTRRLERLRLGVEGLGAGGLARARARRRAGRSGGAGHELQPRRGSHRSAGGRAAHLAGQRLPRAALAPGSYPRGPEADGRGSARTCATAWPGTSRSSTSSSASSSRPAACRRWRSSTVAKRWTCSAWSRRRPRGIRRT